mmetsp:Transcript_79148/g.128248  ORF Transcript_79148/g.128248 Transcript_79148/m.128248 type:complete len:85 (+) Transcript_79148:903-1157(+)
MNTGALHRLMTRSRKSAHSHTSSTLSAFKSAGSIVASGNTVWLGAKMVSSKQANSNDMKRSFRHTDIAPGNISPDLCPDTAALP